MEKQKQTPKEIVAGLLRTADCWKKLHIADKDNLEEMRIYRDGRIAQAIGEAKAIARQFEINIEDPLLQKPL